MLLLGTSARRRVTPIDPPPYAIPTASPYNVTEHLTTPTYDGSGNTVHPDVVDMWTTHGVPQWNGYRFWMLHTPFPGNTYAYENPSILASNDGITWVTPDGLTNPIYPRPSSQWNSDTDLTYDSDTGQLQAMFRTPATLGVGIDDMVVGLSSDGVTWTFNFAPYTPSTGSLVSPAVVREADGSWSMWAPNNVDYAVVRRSSSSILGPWGDVTACTGLGATSWHMDVVRVGATYYTIVDESKDETTGSTQPTGLFVATSTDGLAWTRNPSPVITRGSGLWDDREHYRSTLQPHENGTHMRVWYVGKKTEGVPAEDWHVGLTHIPLTEWPTAP